MDRREEKAEAGATRWKPNGGSRRRCWGNSVEPAGREPRAGRQPRERQAKLGDGTLKVVGDNDSTGSPTRPRAAGGVKALPRHRERRPGGGKPRRGSDRGGG